jgi:putative endopeptidase
MLHGFDEDGSNYDNKGVYRPWWSRSDMAAYARKSKAIIRFFSATEFLGRHMNGKATLSENIADLGGLAIALDALKRHLKGANEATRKKQLQDFFISYAVSWRTKERRKRAIYRLYTDVHAPPELRVNNIVAQLDDWYEVFDVKPGDRLYVDPKDRISIF